MYIICTKHFCSSAIVFWKCYAIIAHYILWAFVLQLCLTHSFKWRAHHVSWITKPAIDYFSFILALIVLNLLLLSFLVLLSYICTEHVFFFIFFYTRIYANNVIFLGTQTTKNGGKSHLTIVFCVCWGMNLILYLTFLSKGVSRLSKTKMNIQTRLTVIRLNKLDPAQGFNCSFASRIE